MFPGLLQFGIRFTHVLDHSRHYLYERRLASAQQPGMSDRPPQNPPQDVSPPRVGRQHTIRQKKRDGASMIRQHPVSDAFLRLRVVWTPQNLGYGVEQRGEHIGLVVRVRSLDNRGKAFKPSPRVNGGRR